ncbi:MAG: M3 family metallopeptidase, partial [Rhodospirillales bacterium]|nr:M3 family metallopeptidase [Rhodospirillales bacterium]
MTKESEALLKEAPGEEELPSWDLTHLYSGPDATELEKDLTDAQERCVAFRSAYEGNLSSIDGAALGKAISEYEEIVEVLHRAMSFAQLLYASDVENPENGRFYQTLSERVTMISSETLFFALELNRIDAEVLAEQLKAAECSKYGPWVRDIRVFKPHQLSDEAEKILHEKSVTGRSAWTRLFDETLAGLRFQVGGEELALSGVLNLLSDPDANKRRAAAAALGTVLSSNLRLFTLITNTLAKDKEIEDQWREFPRPVSARNLTNFVEDEVVDALVSSVRDAFPQLSHRYYALKAKWFGGDKLDYWDRNAPLPDDVGRRYSWQEAQDMVLGAYSAFEPEMAEVTGRFFAERWIDVPPRPGKDSGAFSHPTVPSVHPYILMNYHGKARDVMTLAHELG